MSIQLSDILIKNSGAGSALTTRKYIAIGDSYIDSLQSFVVGGVAKSKNMLLGLYGYAGKRSDQILASVKTSTAYFSGATHCVVCLGMNDLQQGASTKILFDSICELIDDLIKNGICPELVYIAPHNVYFEKGYKYNAVLFYAALTKNIPIYNVFGQFMTNTGAWTVGASGDGVHPSVPSNVTASITLATKIEAGKTDIPISESKSQTGAFVVDPTFSVDTNSDGLADGWTKFGTSVTISRETYGKGYKQVLSVSSQEGSYIFANANLLASRLHKMLFVCEVDMSIGVYPELSILVRGGGTDYHLVQGLQANSDGLILCKEIELLNTAVDGSLIIVELKDVTGASTAKVYGLQLIDMTAILT